MASVTLKKMKRILSTDGGGSLVRRGFRHATGVARVFGTLKFSNAAHRKFDDPCALYDYGQQLGGGVIGPFQVRAEIVGLLERVKSLQPRLILEIGTANGGTLFLFARVADLQARLISVDLPGGEFGEGYPIWKIPLYHSFALPQQQIELIRADSHSTETLERVRQTLGEQAIDFLFIDGDHTYEGVKRDYEMYSPLVRTGGLIALHDVAHHREAECEVERFWNELRSHPGAEELIADQNQGWAGIGVVRKLG